MRDSQESCIRHGFLRSCNSSSLVCVMLRCCSAGC